MSNKVKISSIVAMAKNRAIGKNNAMLWHLPVDLEHFKKTTIGKPIIMGRKSYESLGKPLPGRSNIVVSRKYKTLPNNTPSKIFEDMENLSIKSDSYDTSLKITSSIEDAISLAKDIAKKDRIDEIFIAGGGQIYKETLPYTERLYLTILDKEYEADIFFPEIDWNEWHILDQKEYEAEPNKNRPACTIYTMERKS